MQPTIICVTPAAGMIYLNGRFAGETSPQRPLFAPVSPSGALYLEYVPLEGDWGAMARRLVLSGGMPLAEPLADAEGLCCVAWPGGALEVGLTPPRRVTEYFTLEGLPCAVSRGSSVALSLNGVPVALPAGAGLPRLLRLKDAAALVGESEGGEKYLAALAAERPLAAVGEICDLCVPMQYAVPDARPCVGLLRALNDHLAAVRPLYYRAEPAPTPQSPWQIEAISLE